MKKSIALLLTIALAVSLLAGCTGTTVVIGECTCPTEGNTPAPAPSVPAAEGALKTGLAVVTTVADSTSATAEKNGEAKFDITLAAVAVDDGGVIRGCIIDSVPASVTFDAAGIITSDVTAPVFTKNELGENYGMVAYGNAIAEWDQQVAALAEFAVGKTVEELKNGAIDETGKAPADSDLASSATIYLGGYVAVIEAAAANAQHRGAMAGDTLVLATLNNVKNSADVSEEAGGLAQLDSDITVLTKKDGVITSCYIDAVQAKVSFDAKGQITTDLGTPIPTKNELGENYGMVAYAGAVAEWNEQAASFAAYVTGKTAAEVAGIAIDETTKPTDADLSSSVTISIGGFQALIAKAMQ